VRPGGQISTLVVANLVFNAAFTCLHLFSPVYTPLAFHLTVNCVRPGGQTLTVVGTNLGYYAGTADAACIGIFERPVDDDYNTSELRCIFFSMCAMYSILKTKTDNTCALTHDTNYHLHNNTVVCTLKPLCGTVLVAVTPWESEFTSNTLTATTDDGDAVDGKGSVVDTDGRKAWCKRPENCVQCEYTSH
jgi:hypothetical protein